MKRLHRPGLFGPLNNPRFAAGKNEISRLGSSKIGKIGSICCQYDSLNNLEGDSARKR